MKGSSPMTRAENEDAQKIAVLGMPSSHLHWNAHPTKNDSFFTKLYSCRDMFYDPHMDIFNAGKLTLKGALIGGFAGTSLFLSHGAGAIPSFVLKKMNHYIEKNTFGTLKLFTSIATPLAITGGMIGFCWYIWYHKIWADKVYKDDSMLREMLGFGIFWGATAAIVVNPNLWMHGFIGGGILGLIKDYMFNGNYGGNKNTRGYYTAFGDMDDEQRQRIAQRDELYALTQYNTLKYDELKRI